MRIDPAGYARGMENHDELIREVPSLDDEGVPDHLDPLPGKRQAGDGQEGAPPPNDRPEASTAYGTTEREQRDGEPLGYRLRQEEPDAQRLGDWSGDDRFGRLVEEQSEVDELDIEDEAVADRRDHDVLGMSAEESAVHLEEGR